VRLLTHEKGLLVGAGTVVRPEQVDLAVEAGARFIVMPGLSPRVVERCRELDVLVIPGVATATEVIAALDHGLDLLKLFPAQVAGGVDCARCKGPFPACAGSRPAA
jgi:2-dehydro-3-deoxyphosphogluconate aldolase/(4S)-4-hydroxy-2-oxoglutarate aldolase